MAEPLGWVSDYPVVVCLAMNFQRYQEAPEGLGLLMRALLEHACRGLIATVGSEAEESRDAVRLLRQLFPNAAVGVAEYELSSETALTPAAS